MISEEELERRIKDSHYIIHIEDLEKALENTLGKKGMSDEEIYRIAKYVMNFFGFDERLLDNELRTKDRDLFYMLENEGLLSIDSYETRIEGRSNVWRIHEWWLRKDIILKRAYSPQKTKAVPDESAVYDTLDESVWVRA